MFSWWPGDALEHCLFFHILGIYNHPNWLSYFSEVLKPPTSYYITSSLCPYFLCGIGTPSPHPSIWRLSHAQPRGGARRAARGHAVPSAERLGIPARNEKNGGSGRRCSAYPGVNNGLQHFNTYIYKYIDLYILYICVCVAELYQNEWKILVSEHYLQMVGVSLSF